MTCPCGRPVRLSHRSPLCIVCAVGTKTPRLRKRKLSGNEQEQQRRLMLRLAA